MYDELTKNDIKKMEEEIEYRKLVVRKEAIEAVKEARAQGDLSENFEYGIYHASNEGYMSWYDFAKMIFESTNVDIPVIGIKTKDYKTVALRPLNTSLNKGKLESAVGCMSDAQDALERYVHELKNDDEMKLVLKENDKRWKR